MRGGALGGEAAQVALLAAQIGGIEGGLDPMDLGFEAGEEEDFDDVEAPGDGGLAEEFQVGEGAAGDEGLFGEGDGGGGAAEGGGGAGFDFDEGEDEAVAADEVDFSAFGAAEVAVEDAAAAGVEPAGGDGFAAAADGVFVRDRLARGSPGSVEQRA